MSETFGTEPEQSDESEGSGAEESEGHWDSLIDRMRGTGIGVEDPNIVGDAGPTDIPPGRDPGGDGLFADPPVPAED
jgi:hypothetical protein